MRAGHCGPSRRITWVKWPVVTPSRTARGKSASSRRSRSLSAAAARRARLSSDGSIYTCLFAQTGTDLRGPLRAGADDEELGRIIRNTWTQRTDRYSEQRVALRTKSSAAPKVEMNYIGADPMAARRSKLTHLDAANRPTMVDVGEKTITRRDASAEAW